MGPTLRRLVIGLVVLALLAPIGLWLPEIYKAGSAWGEWNSDELKGMLGYVPKRLASLENAWTKAIFPGYEIPGWTSSILASLGYIISALVGMAIVAGVGYLLGKVLVCRGNRSDEFHR